MLNKLRKYTRSAIVWTVILMLIVCMVPSGIWLNLKPNAANTVTIYFDTYVEGWTTNTTYTGGGAVSNWKKGGPVYIYAWKNSNTSTKINQTMTEDTSKTSKGGSSYKIFKYDIDVDTYDRLEFRGSTNGTSDSNKSASVTLTSGSADTAYMLTGDYVAGGRPLDSYDISGSSAPVGGHQIEPSVVGSGNQVFHNSTIVSNSTTQANTNVKQTPGYVDGNHANNNLFVGQYNYTGRYITYKSDFYDYFSDQEIYNADSGYKATRAGITNSLSNGWTDPYNLFNSVISSDATGTVASDVLELVIAPQGWLYNRNSSNQLTNKLYAWNQNNTPLLGAWSTKGKNVDELKATSGVTVNGNVVRFSKSALGGNNTTQVGFILFFGGAQSVDVKWLKFGHRYLVSWLTNPTDTNGTKDVACKDLGTTYFGSSTGYNDPLYFGCFYVSNTNTDYTSTNAAHYTNFDWVSNIGLRKDGSDDNKYKMRTSVAGLVNSNLNGGTVADPVNGNKLPYFDASWVNAHPDFAACWTDVDFPFYEVRLDKNRFGYAVRDNTGEKPLYYQFNSRDLLSLYLDTSDSTIYEHPNAIYSQSGDDGASKGFYPFNKTNNANKNNLGFGVKYTIPFVLTPDGKIKGIDTTFEFMGDDDVWVFVDGQLALDMGGAHKDAYGVINFDINKGYSILEQSVTYNSNGNPSLSTAASNITFGYSGNNGSVSNSKGLTLSSDSFVTENGVTKYNTSKVHTLTMFFMERGMLESDNFIRFNFIKQNVLDVKNSIEVSNVNAGLQNKTLEAANYDVFDYTLTNTNISVRQDETLGNYLAFVGGLKGASRTVNSNSRTTTALNPTGTLTPTIAKNTGNFSQTPGPVADTLFERTDDYLTNILNTSLTDPDPNYAVGKTDVNGTFGLLYGQDAIFRMQFYSDSTMNLKQENALRRQQNLSTEDALENNNKITSSERTVSSLYTSKWLLKDNNSNVLGANTNFATYNNGVVVNDSTKAPANTDKFIFQNYFEHSSIGVNLTAEFVNRPLTGGLSIKKQIVNKGTTTPATDSYTGNFTIRVKLKDIFGQNSALGNVQLDQPSDYTGIKYTIDGVEYTMGYDSANNCGTITIQNGKTAIISGIPVSTGYEISEAADNTYALDSLYVNGTKVTGTTAGGTIVNSASPAAANTYNVNNTRGLGSLVVNKEITGIGASTDTTKFPVTLTITPPSGVQLTEYFSQATDVVQTNLTDYSATVNATGNSTFSFKVGNGSSLRLNNLPYGTTYSVTENLTGIDGYTQSTTIDDGDPDDAIVNTALENVTITNQKATPTFTLKITKRWSGINPGEKPDVADQYKTVYYLLKRSITGASGSWTEVTEDKAGNHIGETYKSDHDIKVVYDTTDVADATGNIINYTLVENLPVCDESGNLYYYRALEYNTSKSQVYSGSNYDTEGKYKVTYEARGVADGYIQMQETDAGTTQNWGAVNTSTTPYVPPIVMPATGGTPLIFLFPFGIIAITLSGAAMIIYKKKLQGTSLCVKKEGEE